MSTDITEQQTGSSEDDHISLHPLCEEDFPWLLLWMIKETSSSLSLLLQSSRSSTEITIITGAINNHERVSMLTLYAAAFTRLKANYILQSGEYSIQQFQINPLLFNKPQVLLNLLNTYISWIFTTIKAQKIFWEINKFDKSNHQLALKAGFQLSAFQGDKSALLYECAGGSHN
jgi:hypothetical protein